MALLSRKKTFKMKNTKVTTLKQWTSAEQYLINTNQQKTKNCLDHPFLTLLRSSSKVAKWRIDSFHGEQTHISSCFNGRNERKRHFFSIMIHVFSSVQSCVRNVPRSVPSHFCSDFGPCTLLNFLIFTCLFLLKI